MRRDVTGKYVVSNDSGESIQAFVPNPLPSKLSLEISGKLLEKLDRAMQSLGDWASFPWFLSLPLHSGLFSLFQWPNALK